MKIAIIGSSPLALEAAIRFHNHGAALTWFNAEETKFESLFTSTNEPNESYITQNGLDLLKVTKVSDWKKDYLFPLMEILKQEHRLKSYQVQSITKRFLGPTEEIPGKTRFYDLFRIIYLVNPAQFIEEQKETNPETYKRLSEEFVTSLQSTLEMYEDFDLVLDLRKEALPTSMAISGAAVGERKISKDKCFYGLEALQKASTYHPESNEREIALIGSGALAAEMLINLEKWMMDIRNRLFVVSSEAKPFEAFLETANSETKEKLSNLFQKIEQEFENDINEFHTKLRDWQQLDDFVQVKISRPVEPIPRLNFFSGHNVTAIDQLIDKRRLFLTLERPDFREGLKHPENNLLELKTIGADHVLVASKMTKPACEIMLQENEVGFYQVSMNFPNEQDAWKKNLEKLEGIENEIFKLFSPADSH